VNSSFKLRFATIARRLTRSITFGKRLPQSFGGAKVIVAPRSDIRLLFPGYARIANDLFLVADRYVHSGQCVWDLGANLGIFTFAAAWKAGASGQVFALEADPYYANLLHQTRIGLPNGYAPVTPLCAAVADQGGVLDLCIPIRGHSRNHLSGVKGNSAGETQFVKQVCAITGETLMQSWPKPDFIKIDIEGAEHLFFRGIPDFLKTVRPFFYIEVSEDNADEITQVFLSHDYELFKLKDDGGEERLEKCVFNTLAKPRQNLAEV
jgi:FkbM family methyltransferase